MFGKALAPIPPRAYVYDLYMLQQLLLLILLLLLLLLLLLILLLLLLLLLLNRGRHTQAHSSDTPSLVISLSGCT